MAVHKIQLNSCHCQIKNGRIRTNQRRVLATMCACCRFPKQYKPETYMAFYAFRELLDLFERTHLIRVKTVCVIEFSTIWHRSFNVVKTLKQSSFTYYSIDRAPVNHNISVLQVPIGHPLQASLVLETEAVNEQIMQ